MTPPIRGHCHKGTEHTLVRLTYSDIARLAGVSPTAARRYSWRKKYDPRDMDSILKWAVAMRKKRGLPPLGE